MLLNFGNNIKTTTQSYKPYLICYASIYKIELASLLFKQNFIRGFFVEKHNRINYIFVLLKYDIEMNIFNSISVASKNMQFKNLSKNDNGLGFSLISTKNGLMPVPKAQKLECGGSWAMKIN